MKEFTDFLVEVGNPRALDDTLKQLHGALAALVMSSPESYEQVDGKYVMRCFGDPGYVKFACEHQGYCKIIGVREEKLNG